MDLVHASINTSLNFSNHSIPLTKPTIKPWFLTTIFIFFITTFLVGSMGNALLCYVVYKRKERKRTVHLLTVNLAVSDLMVLLVYLPMQLYQINSLMVWELGRVVCKIFYGINAATINANILTLIAITRDRYVAVTDPLAAHSRGTSSVKKWIVFIWVISIILSLPLLIVVDVHHGYCYEIWPRVEIERTYWIILFTLQLVIPLIYFLFAYSMIVYRMRSAQSTEEFTVLYNVKEQCHFTQRRRIEKRRRQQAKLLRLAIILVVAYVVCVSPQHMVFFAFTYGTLANNPNAIYIFIVANFLLIFNSLINPVVYASQSHEMKKMIPRLFCCYKIVINLTHVRKLRNDISKGYRNSTTRTK